MVYAQHIAQGAHQCTRDIRVYLVQSDVRICIGEAMELFLIHGCEYFLVDGR